MKRSFLIRQLGACALLIVLLTPGDAQQPPRPEGSERRGGFGAPGPVREEVKLVKQFDKNKDKMLDAAERKAAREFLDKEQAEGRGPRRPGPPGGRRRSAAEQTAPEPGERLASADVKHFGDEPLYDPLVVRTFFLEFDGPEWEQELDRFYRTDVEVPAKLTVDGRPYKNVGGHFRGASSFFLVDEGRKRSLNLTLDYVEEGQNVGGYRTLNLLNSHTDPTFLRTILYYQIAREYIPAPKANFARVVINGENWGIYINAQQFNKDFTRDFFSSTKGARWKAPGSPRSNAGLTYLGEDIAAYKQLYEIKSKDDPAAWRDLIRLCKTLNETPAERLEKELSPILAIDGTLKFLALENALINSDGYWIRTSDYNLYQDEKGRFHLVPHDGNETFRPSERGDGGESAPSLDPLAGADDPNKPLLHRLLSIPALREKYLGYVRDIAEKSLVWEKLGPVAQKYQALIVQDVKRDTRKLSSSNAFTEAVTRDTEEQTFRGPRHLISLKSFVEQRREYLLNHPEIKKLAKGK